MQRLEVAVCVFLFAFPGSLQAQQGEEGQKLRVLEQKLFEMIRDEYPEFSESTGLAENDGRAESYTFQAFERRKNQNIELLNEINTINKKLLTHNELQDLKILHNHVQTYLKGYAFREWGNLNPINFLEAPLKHRSWISKSMTSDPEKYLSRLQAIPQQIKEQIQLMKRAIQLNRTNHLNSMDGMFEMIWTEIFYVYRHQRHENSNTSSSQNSSRLLHVWNTSTENAVKALNKLAEFIDSEYLPSSRRNIGASSLPGGMEYYQACLDYHLGTRLTPREVHDLGHSEIKRIEKLMKKVMRQVGFTGKISEFAWFLNEKILYEDTKWNVFQSYRSAINSARDSLWSSFQRIPLTPLKIVTYNDSRVPARGHYTNNVFYINVHYENRTTSNVLPLAFHEAYPGHHFQECYKRQQTLPLYRRHLLYRRRYAIPFTYPTYAAYSEGWALYAEQLGMEMGFYKTPLETFQKYLSEIFRACRLVVDTGIHAFGWTKEKAVDFMRQYTNAPYGEVAREIDRYTTWPGQACTYKVGELKIRELRSRAENMLGKQFNIKEFHHQILKTGPISLDILEEIVNDWIIHKMSPIISDPVLSPQALSRGTSVFSNFLLTSLSAFIIVSFWKTFI
ncbi:uncharacterized protein LOC134242593 [Saccostrea cucullata]|uniref:uncharacterized protein LOC134242593 n=1 Tax=Saccostrea cuccullata TaxID=36930 RepID=UPI002ED5F41B